jgi:hypothetical protein
MSNFVKTDFLTPIGRLVWGSLYEPNTEDFDGNPLVVKTGVDKGKPTQSFEFGFAVPKNPGETHWANSPFGAIIWAQGHRDHTNAALTADFSWKATDGDSAKIGKPYKGKPGRAPKDKEGFPGHWVYSFRGSFAPKIVNADGSKYLLDKDVVMPGDCIQIAGNTIGNTGASPGVYLNYEAVSYQGRHRDGRLSTGGIDPTGVGFGQGPKPAWVTDAPVLASGAPGAPPAPPAGAAPTYSAPPPPAQQQVPQIPVQAAPTSYLQPPPPPAAGMAPPPPGAVPSLMTPKANGITHAQFIASGWKDADLRANGYMI